MITAIVLSAGKSSRMGTINKMLLPFGQTTVIRTVVNNLIASEVDEIIVVDNGESKISELLESHFRVRVIVNSEASDGLTSSIQCGVRSSNEKSDGYMICLGDMPLISTLEYNLLVNCFLTSPIKVILIPYFEGKRGNPVFFSSHFKKEILALNEPDGCRPIVQANHNKVKEISFPTDHCLSDIDTMEDYKMLAG